MQDIIPTPLMALIMNNPGKGAWFCGTSMLEFNRSRLCFGRVGTAWNAQQELRMLSHWWWRHKHQHSATESALQAHHVGWMPTSITALDLDHFSGMIAQQHCQLVRCA